MKKCKDCGIEKPATNFYGVQGECKECTKKRIKISSRNIKKKCQNCKKIFGTCSSEIKRNSGKFCSRICFYKYQIKNIKHGKNSHAWKGGRYKQPSGYIKIYYPGHPRADNHHMVYEHIIIMEKYLERFLKDGETVHHINFKKADNKLKNLMLFPTRGSHISFHHSLRKIK